MNHSIRIHQHGGPEVLQWQETELLLPAAHEVQIRHQAIGLNFIDIYHRNGLYPLPLPCCPGLEGAGEVVAVGAAVRDIKVGDRVAYAGPLGAYCESRNIDASSLVVLPKSIDCVTAAAVLMQGLTAQYLVRSTFPVSAGDVILVHAAAGGVGLILTQWAKSLGATVIGVVSNDAKAEIARTHGCDYVINRLNEPIAQRVREITHGEGVAVAYDGNGQSTFIASLDSLRPLGMMVSFGNASGAVPPVDLFELTKRGSLFLTRPTLASYCRNHQELIQRANELFAVVTDGKVRVEINQRYALADVATAHRELEAGRTSGCSVLLPN